MVHYFIILLFMKIINFTFYEQVVEENERKVGWTKQTSPLKQSTKLKTT